MANKSKHKRKSQKIVEVFVGKDRQHYFHVRRRENNEIIANCSQGYSRRIDCIKTAKVVCGGRIKPVIID